MYKAINKQIIDQHNQSQKSNLDFDFKYLEQKLKRSGFDIHVIKEQIKKFGDKRVNRREGSEGNELPPDPTTPEGSYTSPCYWLNGELHFLVDRLDVLPIPFGFHGTTSLNLKEFDLYISASSPWHIL